ncbi:hypothetical protein HYV49_05940 [Candidatus Pacearchaeota archaeon]|nr:hypothetical protein [Candidatus Pacearchaeota archaeon]
MASNKHVLWQALLGACIIFGMGIFLGFMLENYRTARIADLFAKSEIALLDARIQNQIYLTSGFDCDNAVEENIAFGDRVYEEAKILERGTRANKLGNSIIQEHKKYDLLRVLFWMNSINIRQNCNATYHTLVYFYDLIEPSLEKGSRQAVFSNLLGDLKNKYGGEIMLIPIAGDNELTSVSLIMDRYNISELPTILIDEKIKIEELETFEELEQYIIENNKKPFDFVQRP